MSSLLESTTHETKNHVYFVQHIVGTQQIFIKEMGYLETYEVIILYTK